MIVSLLSLVSAVLLADLPGRDTVALAPDDLSRLGVRVEPIRAASHPGTLVLSGTLLVDPNEVTRVRPRFPGIVASVGTTVPAQGKPRPLRPGDPVAIGQVLVTISSPELGQKKNELLDAILRLRLERETFARIEALRKSQVVSAQSFQEAKRELESAEIGASHSDRALRVQGASATEIKEVEAEAERVWTSHQRTPFNAEKNWASLLVKSPVEGEIVAEHADLDDLVGADETLFLIADPRRLIARVAVHEADLKALDAMPRPIRWTLLPKYHPDAEPLEGTVDALGAEIDTESRLATVSGVVDNREKRFRPGQSIVARIDMPANPEFVEVPPSALLRRDGQDYLFVRDEADEGTFILRPVRVARLSRDVRLIRGDDDDGLRPGSHVVVAGAARLKAILDGSGAGRK